MADWSVVGCEVLAAESDAKWDTVHVKMVGQARDADVPATLDAQQAAAQAGRAPLVRYEEVWSFLRKRGSKSKNGVPALEGRCPNCGADLPRQRRRALRVLQGGRQLGRARLGARGDHAARRVAPVDDERRDRRARRAASEGSGGEPPGARGSRDRSCSGSGSTRASPARGCASSASACSRVSRRRTARRCRRSRSARRSWSTSPSGRTGPSAQSTVAKSRSPGAASDNGGQPVNQISRVVLARATTATSKGGLNSLDCPNCRGTAGRFGSGQVQLLRRAARRRQARVEPRGHRLSARSRVVARVVALSAALSAVLAAGCGSSTGIALDPAWSTSGVPVSRDRLRPQHGVVRKAASACGTTAPRRWLRQLYKKSRRCSPVCCASPAARAPCAITSIKRAARRARRSAIRSRAPSTAPPTGPTSSSRSPPCSASTSRGWRRGSTAAPTNRRASPPSSPATRR